MFVSGLTRTLTLNAPNGRRFCKPEHATVEQMTDVFCAHLKNKPAERHGLPSTIFNEALKQAWPCPGGK
jgi:hypothetical protein